MTRPMCKTSSSFSERKKIEKRPGKCFLKTLFIKKFHINRILQYAVLSSWLLSLISISKAHSCRSWTWLHSVLHSFTAEWYSIVQMIPYWLYPFISWGTYGLFPFLAIMNNAAINNYIQVLVWMYAFISLGYFSRSGIAWSYGNCVTNHLNNCQTVCWNIILHFTSLPAMYKGPNNYNTYYCIFGQSHPSGYIPSGNLIVVFIGMYLMSWAPKSWCFWTVVLEKTLENPLDCKEIQPVHPRGDQSWVFIGRTDGWSWNSNTLATSCEELSHWKRPWCWEGFGAGEWNDRGWDGWMASPTRWTWIWVNSRSWWWTGRPGVLWFMESQRVGHDWATEMNWTEELFIY